MEIKLNIGNTGFKKKPEQFPTFVKNRICRPESIREIHPLKLVEAIRKGKAFTPAVMVGPTEAGWRSQQVICANINNSSGQKDTEGNSIMIPKPLKPKQAMKIMEEYGINHYFMYHTFRHKAEWPKFRILLLLREPITDPATAKDLISRFTQIFNSKVPHSADTGVNKLDSIFYGTIDNPHAFIGLDVHGITDIETLLNLPEVESQGH